MRKGTFFQEGQCAALTSFRVGKMSFLWKKGMFFTILLKRCEKGWTEASLADMFWAEMTKMSKTSSVVSLFLVSVMTISFVCAF